MRLLVALTLAFSAGLFAQSTDELFRAAGRGDEAALQRLRALADKGDAGAEFDLGVMYGTHWGVPKDAAQAAAWYRKAAEQGVAGAQFSLGAMYESGEGVIKDSTQAVAWYRKAAEQGDVEAQKRLSFLSAEAPIASGTKTNDILTNTAVVALVKAELPADVIVTKIKGSDCRFQLDTDGLIALKQSRVSDEIIRAMLARSCGNSLTGNSSLSAQSDPNSQAMMTLSGVTVGRAEAAIRNGNLVPARFAKIYAVSADKAAAIKPPLDAVADAVDQLRTKAGIDELMKSLVELECVKALNKLLPSFVSVQRISGTVAANADENGDFELKGLLNQTYTIFAIGRVGLNVAIWLQDLVPSRQTDRLKLTQPIIACYDPDAFFRF